MGVQRNRKEIIETFRIAFTANGKREIRVFVFLKNGYIDENSPKIILTFDADAKLLNFTEKLKTASGKYRVNMVTRSLLPFDVCSN